MGRKRFGCVLTVMIVLAAVETRAHHSFWAAYDPKGPMTVQGVVTKVQWENPHAWIYLDVKDASGKVVNWGFEPMRNPIQLVRIGVTPAMLKPGVQLTMRVYRARDKSRNLGGASELIFADGKSFRVGPILGDPTPQRLPGTP